MKYTYLFFTGGYDSTYRLCDLVINQKKTVVPIYINDPNIDNINGKKVKRRNNKQEKNSQIKIIEKIADTFPECKELIKEPIIIDNVKTSKEVEEGMKRLKQKKYVRRARCQYGAMAQISLDLKKPIEMCAEKGGHFQRKLNQYIDYKSLSLNVERDPDLELFRFFKLPVIHMTKNDMLIHSKASGFDEILKHSWSCWYPRKNGDPCNKCIMCRERIVPVVMEGFQVKETFNYNFRLYNTIGILMFIILVIILNMCCFNH